MVPKRVNGSGSNHMEQLGGNSEDPIQFQTRELDISPDNLLLKLLFLEQGDTSGLRTVRISDGIDDDQLVLILESLGNNPTVRTISINNCNTLTQINVQFPDGLSRLLMNGLSSLTCIPKILPRYLRELAITDAISLTSLPDSLPAAIRALDLSGCSNLISLPQPLPTKLMELITIDCPKIASKEWSIPHTVSWLRNLERLDQDNLEPSNQKPVSGFCEAEVVTHNQRLE